jgi:asparagine synthase (glutamine-hydrolysing)
MCGIAGIAHWDGRPIDAAVLKHMADALVHRGPDEEGLYLNGPAAASQRSRGGPPSGASVGLAHRRLSIIDLATGQQPLANEDQSVWIVFNGEIYNFAQLRGELSSRGFRFRTSSDTEVIVHAYEEWGEGCLSHLNGMFAFCIWDDRRQQLFLARDRIGKKPLYYHTSGNTLVFGSELKALRVHPGVATRLDPTAVADYFKYLYIPDPKSIFAGVSKLLPGHYLIAGKGGSRIHEYWDVPFHEPGSRTQASLEDELLGLLEQAVRERMVAEVPLGAFLSGGIDSSGIVALMAELSRQPVITCSIGFPDPRHDESRFAAEVARALGTDHTEYFVRDGFMQTVRQLPAMFDEPFADASAVPTYFVCRMARQRVTVALSGDGGDEAFAGYEKYVKDRIEQRCGQLLPRFLLHAIHQASGGGGRLRAKARTLTAQAMRSPARAFYQTNTFITDRQLRDLLAPWLRSGIQGYDPSEYTTRFFERLPGADHLTRMLYTDLKTYLPGDILVKVDRMSMAQSLEVRSPLLDHRIVEFALNLPTRQKIRGRKQKYLLKRVLAGRLPHRVLRRPKHGFTVPLDGWFRSELLSLAQEVFFESPETRECLDVRFVRGLLDDHRAGRADNRTLLWSTLMFGLWYRELRRAHGQPGSESAMARSAS